MVLALVGQRAEEGLHLHEAARREAALVHGEGLHRQLLEAEALELAGDAVEAQVHDVLVQADGIGNLRTLIAPQCRDAHFGHDLQQALADCLLVLGEETRLGRVLVLRHLALLLQRQDGLVGQVGADGISAKGQQQGMVADLVGLATVNDQRRLHTPLLLHQRLVHSAAAEERWNGHLADRGRAVGEDHDLAAGIHGLHHLLTDAAQVRLHARGALLLREGGVNGLHAPALHPSGVGKGGELRRGQARLVQPEPAAMRRHWL
mmetsp:Transcript_65623/g.168919  ORF Transcript_65623/g.168919 Transcript_65623/m.168919 type:complete len:262 (+) Transcript_65623:556-1341(+)